MQWKKFTINTRAQAEEVITGLLAELDIYSVEIEDSVPLTEAEKAQMFVDIAPERENDGSARISFYVEEQENYQELVLEVKKALEEYKALQESLPEDDRIDMGSCSIEASDTEDKDWINNWKQYFSHFYIDDILFEPSWEMVREEQSPELLLKNAQERYGQKTSMIINIDPGTAFGTGKHETTQLCIRALRENVKEGMEILDVGTGSGILAMMALKFGAAGVFATDLDPCAIPACEDNFKKNGLEGAKFELTIGNLIDDKKVQDKAGYKKYDIVVANILADILIPLTPAAVGAMKEGGLFITSGIIEGREGDVAEAMKKAGLEVTAIQSQGEWRCVIGRA